MHFDFSIQGSPHGSTMLGAPSLNDLLDRYAKRNENFVLVTSTQHSGDIKGGALG